MASSKNLHAYNLEAPIPKFLLVRQGVISNIDTYLSEDTIKNKIKQFDYHSNFEIEAVRRITKTILDKETKEKKVVKTGSVIVTFRAQNLPKYVAMGHVRVAVNPYIQRVILCFNCYRYGHSGKQCKSQVRCLGCKKNHTLEECTESNKISCFYCNGNHATNVVNQCTEFTRQKQIKKAMAEQTVSFKEAEKLFPKKTYASISAQNSDVNLSDIDIIFNNSLTSKEPSQNKPTHFTVSQIPKKRGRPMSPNPTFQEHKNILSQFRIPLNYSSVFTFPSYQTDSSTVKNIETETNCLHIGNNINLMTELISSIIQVLKENNGFNINKSDLSKIIIVQLNEVIKQKY